MTIKNNYFIVEIKNKDVFYNLNKIEYNNYIDLYNILKKYISRKPYDELILFDCNEKLNDIEQLILLVLANFYRNVYLDNNKKHQDITFSYNFPIIDQPWIIPRLLELGSIVFESNMIALGDSNEFIEVDVSDDDSYHHFYKKYGCYIRKGDNIFDIRNCNLDVSLNYWNDYCMKKHNVKFSDSALKVYEDIYSTVGFNSIKIMLNNENILHTVYFKDEKNKKLYFCILGWNESYKKYSPGIYIYSKAIEYCYKNNYKFSFCYGLQQYKINLLKFFKEFNNE